MSECVCVFKVTRLLFKLSQLEKINYDANVDTLEGKNEKSRICFNNLGLSGFL